MSQPLSDSEKFSLLQARPRRMFRMFSPNTFSCVHETSVLLRSLVWVMRKQSLVSGVRLQSRVACYFMSRVAEQPAGNNSFFASEGTMSCGMQT